MTAPTEAVEAALALVDKPTHETAQAMKPFKLVSDYSPIDTAARILAAEVRRQRAELASQPMIATETHVLPPRK